MQTEKLLTFVAQMLAKMAKDIYPNCLRNALEKEGWKITNAPCNSVKIIMLRFRIFLFLIVTQIQYISAQTILKEAYNTHYDFTPIMLKKCAFYSLLYFIVASLWLTVAWLTYKINGTTRNKVHLIIAGIGIIFYPVFVIGRDYGAFLNEKQNTLTKMYITKAFSNRQDITAQILEEENAYTVFYTKGGNERMYMSNVWRKSDSQSFGPLYPTTTPDTSTHQQSQSEVLCFKWLYTNTYDAQTDTAKVSLIKDAAHHTLEVKIITKNFDTISYCGYIEER